MGGTMIDEWIRLDEKLPDINERVLVYTERKLVFANMYAWVVSIAVRYEMCWADVTGMEIKPPLCWMPLPLPPPISKTGQKGE